MEIHGLLPFLRKFVKNMNLCELAGQTAAIDEGLDGVNWQMAKILTDNWQIA